MQIAGLLETMDIVEFFEISSGKWFSQRTSHYFDGKQSEAGKSDLLLELLDKAAPEVAKLCKQHCVDPTLALCGIKVTQNSPIEAGSKKHSSSSLLVPVANSASANEGKLLRETSSLEKTPAVGRYVVGTDESVTLIIENDTLYFEERVWFASPNLRLRTSLMKQSDGFKMGSFCSEIRMGVTKPAEAKTA